MVEVSERPATTDPRAHAAAGQRPASHATASLATAPGAPAPGALAARARADGVSFILAMFADLAGKPCAKLVPVEAADALERDGVGFAGFAVGTLGQQPSDPDLIAMPDIRSYAPLPWVRSGLAVVQCDLYVEGQPWRFTPRQILRNVLARTARTGFELKAGAEIEYFLVQRGPDGALSTSDEHDTAAKPCYDARSVTRMYEHLTVVSSAMTALGWGNYANDHEDGNGQFEQNFDYADALTTADRVMTARYLIAMLAEQRGMTATFMPKPFSDRTGSGMHLHLSLWEGERPRFSDSRDARGLGLSATAYGFVAGVLAHAAGLQALIAPTVNSYKRTGARGTTSGAAWSPGRVSYGRNDRTQYIRVPDGDRIELRGSDGSANPYLALAGVLAAGLDGIERGLDPGDPCPPGVSGPDAPELPITLLHACDALAADPVLSAALGTDVTQYFVAAGREQFLSWHAAVSSWEIDKYLTAF
jgi:glutamine synthetase